MESQLIESPQIDLHSDESSNSISPELRDKFFKHKNHFILFTIAGKPIFSRYGEDIGTSSLCAAFSAIVPKLELLYSAQSVNTKKTQIKYIKSKNMLCVFLLKGSLYCIAISKTEKSYKILKAQLKTLYIQVQYLILLIVHINDNRNSK